MYKYLIKRAEAVIEALPYLRKFHGKTVVIKYGGAAMVRPKLKQKVITDIVLLKYVGLHPIVVHGGGWKITKALKSRKKKIKFIEGLRVTDEKTMEVVNEVLGRINRRIVSLIGKAGGKGRGLSGKKGKLIKARKLILRRQGEKIDLGFAGEVRRIDIGLLETLSKRGFIPVVSSIGIDRTGQLYNINADQAASAVASALQATKLIYLTDVSGVLDKDEKLVSLVDAKHARKMIRRGIISGGMIPKVKCCLEALKKDVESTHIIDGRIPHAILLEIFTDYGIGTMVTR